MNQQTSREQLKTRGPSMTVFTTAEAPQKPTGTVSPEGRAGSAQDEASTKAMRSNRPRDRSIPVGLALPPKTPSSAERVLEIAPDTNPLRSTSPHTAQIPVSQGITNIAVRQPAQPIPVAFEAPSPPLHRSQNPVRGGSWHYSLFSCASPGLCLTSLGCPCLIYGRSQYRLSAKSTGRDPTNVLGFSFVNGSCLAWSLLPGINILLSAIQHTRVKKAYDMDDSAGGMASACVQSSCCCCCVIAQDEKEMKWRDGRDRQGCRGEGYRSVGEMSFISRSCELTMHEAG